MECVLQNNPIDPIFCMRNSLLYGMERNLIYAEFYSVRPNLRRMQKLLRI